MPIKRLINSPKFIAKNPHVQTIYPNFFRSVDYNLGTRKLLTSEDGVNIEVFLKKPRSEKLVIFTHGLEGDAGSNYILGMRKLLERKKWDSLSWNMRNCGNHTLTHTVYHAGRTKDLAVIVDHAVKELNYKEVYLVGYSLGGCLTLNYINRENAPNEVKGAVTVSSPMNLAICSDNLTTMRNRHYQLYFLTLMYKKVRILKELYPDHYKHLPPAYKLNSFRQFDKYITAPLSGMKDDHDYYEKHSPYRELLNISIPVKVITSQDDPFLDQDSRTHPHFYKNPHITPEILKFGGHCGFWKDLGKEYFSERRIFDFLENVSKGKTTY